MMSFFAIFLYLMCGLVFYVRTHTVSEMIDSNHPLLEAVGYMLFFPIIALFHAFRTVYYHFAEWFIEKYH